MTSASDAFTSEVERSRCVYDEYDAAGRYETVWTAFDELDAAYRARQALAMATLMRGAGFLDLRRQRVLDVGCGRGRQLRSFVDAGARPEDLAGIDIHEPSIQVARSLAPHLRFDVYNGWDIPFPDGSFDLVTQFVVFSSVGLLDLRRRLAAEMLRVLRPGGYVFWWDGLRYSDAAAAANAPLDPATLFPECSMVTLRIGQRATLGEAIRVPRRARRAAHAVLDHVPIVNYPATHCAALIGPKN
jgi:SAM-dependent methyltransferase